MAAEGARALSDEDVALAVAENEAVEVGVPVVEWDGGEREAVKVRVRERERVRLRVGVPGKLRDGEAERDPVGLGLAVWVRQLDVVGVRERVVGAGSRRQTRLLAPPALGWAATCFDTTEVRVMTCFYAVFVTFSCTAFLKLSLDLCIYSEKAKWVLKITCFQVPSAIHQTKCTHFSR